MNKRMIRMALNEIIRQYETDLTHSLIMRRKEKTNFLDALTDQIHIWILDARIEEITKAQLMMTKNFHRSYHKRYK